MTATAPDPQTILALPMRRNDAGAATVRDYLVALLTRLWDQEVDFSGKRPFGNSGWTYDLYGALVDGGLVAAADDDADCDLRCPQDPGAAYDLIATAITALGAPAPAAPPVTRDEQVETYLDEALAVDPATVPHPNHDYATDGWRWHCQVCNPMPTDLPHPDYPDYDEPLHRTLKDDAA